MAACPMEKVVFLNDFVAIAYGISELQPTDLIHLNPEVKPVTNTPVGVIGPGTGIGEATLFWNGTKYMAWGSEGGHGDFGPKTELQRKYAVYMSKLANTPEFDQFNGMKGSS